MEQQNNQELPQQNIVSVPEEHKNSRKIIKGVLLSFVLFIFLSVIVFFFFATPFSISGGGNSIKPFVDGQLILSEKLTYVFQDPKPGDRILFRTHDNSNPFVGVITDVKENEDSTVYIVYSQQDDEWDVTKDKIIGRIYYPFMDNNEVLNVVNTHLSSKVTPTPILIESSNTIIDSSWKTYTNDTYQLTFKYPPDYTLTENANGSISLKYVGQSETIQVPTIRSINPEIDITIQNGSLGNKSLKQFVDSFISDPTNGVFVGVTLREYMVNDISGYIFEDTKKYGNYYVFLPKGTAEYIFIKYSITGSEKMPATLLNEQVKEILSTFTYTN